MPDEELYELTKKGSNYSSFNDMGDYNNYYKEQYS